MNTKPFTILFIYLVVLTSFQEGYSKVKTGGSHVDPVRFVVFDVQRPITRSGKTLTSPREVYLYASRKPKKAESKKRRITQNQKKQQHSGPSWYGKVLRVYRLSSIKSGVKYPSPEQLEIFNRMREEQNEEKAQRNLELERRSKEVSPISLEPPTLPNPALEDQEDDDDLEMPEEGEICGHHGEGCCQKSKRGRCEVGLVCLKDQCLPPPPPCGKFEQPCCEQEPHCLLGGLLCLSGELEGDTQMMCLPPPPPPTQKKTSIGILKIISVQGRMIKAQVLHDALSLDENRPMYAIKVKDLAEWY